MKQYISRAPDEKGQHTGPQSYLPDGLELPAELITPFVATMGFAFITAENDVVTSVEINQPAYDAYLAERPVLPPEPEQPSADEIIDILLGGDSDE